MQRKINLIIDTDVANEIDDSFAIVYAFANQDRFNIEAITLAPFIDKKGKVSVEDGMIDSFHEALRILRYVGEKSGKKVFKGSEGFMSNHYSKITPSVEKIIQTAKSKNTTIVCLGPLTNVALAIKKAPEILKNINIIWLGTEHVYVGQYDDTNYIADKVAFEYVIKSGALMTIIPSYVGKFIVTSKYEFKKNIAVNDIGRYLLKKLCPEEYEFDDIGIKNIYDLAPLFYLVNRNWFYERAISANTLLKEQQKVSMGILVNYVYDMKPLQDAWEDFIKKVTKFGNAITPSQIFFISDTHFGDNRRFKIKETPFHDVNEMNGEMIKRWNSVVSKKDTVYHLGDFGDFEFVKRLNGNVILILGNHDKARMGKDFEAFRQKLIGLGFKDVIKDGLMLDAKILGEKVFLTHKPTDARKDCFTLFGHVHTLKPIKRNGFNVCVTYHDFTPISLKEIKKHMNFVKYNADEDVFAN